MKVTCKTERRKVPDVTITIHLSGEEALSLYSKFYTDDEDMERIRSTIYCRLYEAGFRIDGTFKG